MKIKLDTSNFEAFLEEQTEYRERYLDSVKILNKDWKRIEDAIITRASSLLPFQEFPAEFTVSISIPDKESDSESSVSIDPIFTTQTEAFVSKVSHKVHSLLCYELLKYDVEDIDETERGILRVMETIHIEGIGDHIDKDYFVSDENHTFTDEKYVTEFKTTLRNIPKTITSFNEIIKKLSQEVSRREKLGEELREFVPPYGNPLGYYMVNVIIKNSFLDEMLRSIGNPFNFFKLYNKAVMKDRVEIPSFSEDTIKLINELEMKYIK